MAHRIKVPCFRHRGIKRKREARPSCRPAAERDTDNPRVTLTPSSEPDTQTTAAEDQSPVGWQHRYCPSSAPCWPSACPGSACSLVGSFFLYPTGLGPVAGQHEVSSSGPCTWTWQAGSRHPRSLWRFLCSPHGNELSSSLLTMEGQVLQKEKERGLC